MQAPSGPTRWVHGEGVWKLERPTGSSEDVSRVLSQVPGAFLVLGATPADLDPTTAADHHAPRSCFDDAALPVATRPHAERRCGVSTRWPAPRGHTRGPPSRRPVGRPP